MIDAERRSAVALAAVALAALALALVLAFVSTRLHFTAARGEGALRAAADERSSPPARRTKMAPPITIATVAPTLSGADGELAKDVTPKSLWTLLTPWALAIDALAVLGMAVVFAVRHGARRRRRARS